MASTSKGPDFLCVGTTRSGTTFLHARLREPPGVWLPPQNETHYFNVQRSRGFWNAKHRRYLRTVITNVRRAATGKRGPVDELVWQMRYLCERLIGPTDALRHRFGGYAALWHRRMERVLAGASSSEPLGLPAGHVTTAASRSAPVRT